MKILKQGIRTNPNSPKIFVCQTCGCVFEAEEGEYKSDFQYNILSFYSMCPICNAFCNEREGASREW